MRFLTFQLGAAIPFGRSLTYRFAFAAFWAAAAVADVTLPSPLDTPGAVKGMLLRHLRWWSGKPDIFNSDGTPNIGYTYPNMYMAENYNSPQSVFWCLKSFLVIGLPETHSFWKSDEVAHPMSQLNSSLKQSIPEVMLVAPPKQIVCNTPEHHFLLSAGQSTSKRFKAREAKYGKFAYSSAFAFSVPCGPLLEQLAPDSTLAVSWSTDENWKVRWEPFDVLASDMKIGNVVVPVLTSSWKPWPYLDLVIKTTLIPPVSHWPGWHLRIHRVTLKETPIAQSLGHLRFVDAGFAASAQTYQDASIFEQPTSTEFGTEGKATNDGCWRNDGACLIISESGTSGIINLTNDLSTENHNILSSESSVIRADPNT